MEGNIEEPGIGDDIEKKTRLSLGRGLVLTIPEDKLESIQTHKFLIAMKLQLTKFMGKDLIRDIIQQQWRTPGK